MIFFGEKKKILFFMVLLGLFIFLGNWAYSFFRKTSNFRKTTKCVTGLLYRGKALECGLAMQGENRMVVVGKINKLKINKDQEIFAEIALVNIKEEKKEFLFLLNSGGVVPITLHQGRDILNWNDNNNQYLRYTADEFSKIQEKLRVGRAVYLLISTDCDRKYCNDNRLLLDWLNGNDVNFDIFEGKCYLNSNQVEYSSAD